MSRTEKSITKNIDWGLLLLYLLFLLMGLVNIYSASYNPNHPFIFDLTQNYGKHIVWICIALFGGFVLFLIDAEIIRKSSYLIYGITLILLIAVLFTPKVNGARSWFGIGSFGIQPSEFAKMGTALALSAFLSRINIKVQNMATVTQANLIILLPMLLIILQPDAGTFLVFTGFLFVMYREGMSYDPLLVGAFNWFSPKKIKKTLIGGNFIPIIFIVVFLSLITLLFKDEEIIIPLVDIPVHGKFMLLFILTVGALIVTLIVYRLVSKRERRKLLSLIVVSYLFAGTLIYSVGTLFSKLSQHQKERIELVLGLIQDPNGKDYNRYRAMAAVGSGGFNGKGYIGADLASPISHHVPEQETDFIFCTFAEEWGFLGSFFLLVLYIIFLVKIIGIAERQRLAFNRVYAYSIAMIFFLHFAVNIGMNIGLMPVIGIPLPFFSYGGSSLLSFSAMFFILLKLDSERNETLS
jgi:rod shape determining protein RodA